MNVNVLFFGAAADAVQARSVALEADDSEKSREVFDRVLRQYPLLASHKLLFAVNQEYASGDEVLHEGDELAIFTAVSGG